ncbi:hypothetical protein B7463_g261, partial [Scytalidium lignicola]
MQDQNPYPANADMLKQNLSGYGNVSNFPREFEGMLKTRAETGGTDPFSVRKASDTQRLCNAKRNKWIHECHEPHPQHPSPPLSVAPTAMDYEMHQKTHSKAKSTYQEPTNPKTPNNPDFSSVPVMQNKRSYNSLAKSKYSNSQGQSSSIPYIYPPETKLPSLPPISPGQPVHHQLNHNQRAAIISTPNNKSFERSLSQSFPRARRVTAPPILCQTTYKRRNTCVTSLQSSQQTRNLNRSLTGGVVSTLQNNSLSAISSISRRVSSTVPLFYDYSEEFETENLNLQEETNPIFDADSLSIPNQQSFKSTSSCPGNYNDNYVSLDTLSNTALFIPIQTTIHKNGVPSYSKVIPELIPLDNQSRLDNRSRKVTPNRKFEKTKFGLTPGQIYQHRTAVIGCGGYSIPIHAHQTIENLDIGTSNTVIPTLTKERNEDKNIVLRSLVTSMSSGREATLNSTPANLRVNSATSTEQIMNSHTRVQSQDDMNINLRPLQVLTCGFDSVPGSGVGYSGTNPTESAGTKLDGVDESKRFCSLNEGVSKSDVPLRLDLLEDVNSSKMDEQVSHTCDVPARTPMISPTLPDETLLCGESRVSNSSSLYTPSPRLSNSGMIGNLQDLGILKDPNYYFRPQKMADTHNSLDVYSGSQSIRDVDCKKLVSHSELSILSPKPISLVEQSRLKNSIPQLTKLVPSSSHLSFHSTASTQPRTLPKASVVDSLLPFQDSSSASVQGPVEGESLEQDPNFRQITNSMTQITFLAENITEHNELSSENQPPFSSPSKFRLKRRHPKTLNSSFHLGSITQPEHSSSRTSEHEEHIKYAKFRLRNIRNFQSGHGTVRVKRPPERVGVRSCWYQSHPRDLFTTPSGLDSVLRKGSDRISRQKTNPTSIRRPEVRSRQPSSESTSSNQSHHQMQEPEGLSRHLSKPSGPRDAVEIQSYFSADTGHIQGYPILRKKLSNFRHRILAPFALHQSRDSTLINVVSSQPQECTENSLPSQDIGQPMSMPMSEHNESPMKYKAHPNRLNFKVSRWIKEARMVITNRRTHKHGHTAL